jgi:hypothetical protein
MVDKSLVLENRRGILSSKRMQERQTQQNTNPSLVSMSILCLLDLSSAPFHRAIKRCLDRLAKDLLPLSSRWFRAPISFRLQTLGIRVLKEPQPLQMQHWIKWTPLASTVDRRVIMLIIASVDINHPPQLQERLHHRQTVMEALPRPKLNRITLEEGWIKWLWKKLRTPQPWCPVHLSSIPFCLNRSFYSFLFYSWVSRDEIPVKGGNLVTPQNFKFWTVTKIR